MSDRFIECVGYTTNSVLCIPIMGENEVYGVVEMINKKGGGAFTNIDQDYFRTFTLFCAFALRYAKVSYFCYSYLVSLVEVASL